MGLSFRAAGKAVGVSHNALRKAAQRGHLRLLPDGSVDPVGLEEWKTNRRPPRGGNPKSVTEAAVTEPPKAAGPATSAEIDASGLFLNRASAELASVTYVARTRKLEYEARRAQLVEIDRAVRDVERDYGEVKTKLMALPPEWSPRLFRCKTILELEGLLTALITEALEALSRRDERREAA